MFHCPSFIIFGFSLARTQFPTIPSTPFLFWLPEKTFRRKSVKTTQKNNRKSMPTDVTNNSLTKTGERKKRSEKWVGSFGSMPKMLHLLKLHFRLNWTRKTQSDSAPCHPWETPKKNNTKKCPSHECPARELDVRNRLYCAVALVSRRAAALHPYLPQYAPPVYV
jgi:hypothetical protein